jgi:putative flippase GtrA
VLDKKSLFILVGCINTLIGYLIALGVYLILNDLLHIIIIGIIINILNITISFVSYKLLVFKVRGNWLHEYLKSYLVYGIASILGVAALWLLVDKLSTPFWIAQAVTVLVVAIFSYFSHLRFTFNTRMPYP